MFNPGSLTNQSEITLKIAHEKLSGFEGLQVVRAIDAASDAYSFSLPWDPTDKNRERFRPFFVRNVQVLIDDGKVITGYIEKIGFVTSADGRRVNVQGRSASGVIVDWSAGPPFQFENMTFNNISKALTQAIFSGFTAGVAFASPDTDPIGEVSIEPGESVYKVLTNLASAQNLWARPTATGRLEYLQLSSTRSSVATLIEGTSPVRLITTDHDVTKRFQLYRVLGTSEGEPELSGEVSDYESLGLGVRGRQINNLKQQTTDINQAAKFARSRAIIDSYTATVEVDGWHYNNHLWTPGEIITVQAPGAFIFEPSRLIILRVTMKIDESGGQAAVLDLGLPEAFDGTEPKLEGLPWAG